MLNKNKYNLNFQPDSYLIGNLIKEDFQTAGEKEIEIARVSLMSVHLDIYSIIATHKGSSIFYSIKASTWGIDEYDTEIIITQQQSVLPLTMAELINLIDNVEQFDDDTFGKGLTNAIRNYNLEAVDGDNPEELVDFVSVTSEFYPQLNAYYEEEAIQWLEQVKSKL